MKLNWRYFDSIIYICLYFLKEYVAKFIDVFDRVFDICDLYTELLIKTSKFLNFNSFLLLHNILSKTFEFIN